MDAVENISLQISHSTSSHNDLYVLGLRKKKERNVKKDRKIIAISFSAAETTVNGRHHLSLLLSDCFFLLWPVGKSQYHAVANTFNEANCQCLA